LVSGVLASGVSVIVQGFPTKRPVSPLCEFGYTRGAHHKERVYFKQGGVASLFDG
jgi:hypothetical protein